MTKKNHGVFWGLLLGSAAASIAYLSLSSSKKDQLLKNSAKKIDDLNAYLQDKSKQVLDAVSEKYKNPKMLLKFMVVLPQKPLKKSGKIPKMLLKFTVVLPQKQLKNLWDRLKKR